MKKKFYKYIKLLIAAYCIIGGENVFSQSPTMTLTQSNTSSGNYFARDAVILKPPFSASASQYPAGGQFHAYIDKNFVYNVDYLQTIVDESNKVINTSLGVGVIDGKASVTAGGAATYQIPLFCSPGTNGVQPQLSISYSSQSGYGSLGWGWDLFGTSSISRTSKTLCQDGILQSVTMTYSDVYALDGNRLYAYSSGMYGNALYRSEIASFSEISSTGNLGGGPESFKVTTPDGSVKEYGNTSDSRKIVNGDGAVCVWRLNKVTDINGNYMEYHYNTAGLLSSIDYTGNTAAGLDTYNHIEFVYANRADQNITYPGYSAALEDKYLLTEILVKNESSLVKKYVFNYKHESTDIYSLLNEIVESDGNSNELNSTVVSWNDKLEADSTQLHIEACNKALYSVPSCTNIVYWIGRAAYRKNHPYENSKKDEDIYTILKPNFCSTIYGDFNGDGNMDIMEFTTVTTSSPSVIDWKMYLFNKETNNYSDDISPDATGTISVTDQALELLQPMKADLDGNGKDYIYLAIDHKQINDCVDSVDLVCYKFENSSLTELPEHRIKNMASRGVFGNSENELGYYISFLDLNGDGKDNEMMFEKIDDGGRYIYNNVPVSMSSIEDCEGLADAESSFIINAKLYLPGITDGKMELTDINGNGKVEIMHYYPIAGHNSGYHFYEFDGTEYQEIETFPNSSIQSTGASVHTGDFNGDGKTDLLMHWNDNTWKLLISKGDGFETLADNNTLLTKLNTDAVTDYDGEIICQDYNGDGKADVLYNLDAQNQSYISIFYSAGRDFKEFDYGAMPEMSLMPLGDMNGDGNADLIYNKSVQYMDACTSTYTHFVFVNPDKKPLLVKTITDGYLQSSSFAYKPMTDASIYTIGNNASKKFLDYRGASYLVSDFTQPDGIGGTSTTSYTYEGGIVHKLGKGLLGFTKVTAQNNVSLVKTESNYVLDTAYLMMNLTDGITTSVAENTTISRVQSTYETVPLYGSNGHGYYEGVFPYISASTETNSLTGTVTQKTFNYGSGASDILEYKGNIKSLSANYGSDGTVVTTNTYDTQNYATANGSTNLTKLTETSVTSTAGSEAAYTKTTGYTYNSNGLLASTIDYKNISGGQITTSYSYLGNYFGNVVKKTISASGMTDRYTSYEYDIKGRFVTKETNMLGQETNYQYNTKFGLKTSVTDILGNTTQYVYDGFGNVTHSILPNGDDNLYSRTFSQNTSIPNSMYYTTATLVNAPDVTTYYDAYGRDLKTISTGLNNVTLYADKEYYAKGQLYRSSLPYQSGAPKWTTYTYDNYNRPTNVDNNGLPTTYGYSGKTVTVTDPAGNNTSKTINDMGQVTEATDQGGSVSYEYYSSGLPKTITSAGSVITYTYNDYGKPTTVVDPDAGTTNTLYDLFGEVTSQTDANGNVYTFEYDNAGRLTSKSGPEGIYNYTYITTTADSCGGLPHTIGLTGGDLITYAYNRYGQVLSETRTIDGNDYVFANGYDKQGNKVKVTYPNGFNVKRLYDSDGRLTEVKRGDNDIDIWKVDFENELGMPTQIKQGDNLLTTTYSYDNYYRVTRIHSALQDDQYSWNPNTGNLTSRTNNLGLTSITESFTYDPLNRLREIRLNNVVTKEMTYGSNGNIQSKTDAGANYIYDPTKTHAVTQIQDQNDVSAIGKEQQEITYTAFNKIKTIEDTTANGYKLEYFYGPDMQRNRMEYYDINQLLVKKRLYDGLYESETKNNITTEYCYVEGGFGVTAVKINSAMYYLRRDHQGSITGLIDDQGSLAEEYSYDAWGRRRNPTDWTYTSIPTPQLMFRGYTMHEMLDDFGLINMNGRCYDPIVGRFLSPDIVVQDANSTQSYNRYSYCINNPLKYTDPSGWTTDPLWSFNGHNAVRENYSDYLYSLQKKGYNSSTIGMINSICQYEGIGYGNSLGSAGGLGEALMDSYSYSADMDRNRQNVANISAVTETTKYDDGREETTVRYFYNGVLFANGSINKFIENNKEKINVIVESVDKSHVASGFVIFGIGKDAAWESANFTYSAGERCGKLILTAEDLTNEGRAFYKALELGLDGLGKKLFWVGVGISLLEFGMHPSVKQGIESGLDIAALSALEWGGEAGAIAAGLYFGIKYTIGWNNAWVIYKYGPLGPYNGWPKNCF